MSLPQLSPFSIKAPGGPSEELVATVPDLNFGVLPVSSCLPELNCSDSFTNSRKRNRSDSGCSLSDFEISGDEADFSFNSKRTCSGVRSPHYTPITYPATKEFTLELDAVLQFCSGAVSSSQEISTSQPFGDYPLHPRITPVFTGMQTPELHTNPCKQDLMLNCDKNCKLVISEHPEEYYRARYGSEGVRAPLKGRTENFPTVEVIGSNCKHVGIVTVKLVHEDGSDHTSCSLDSSEERKNALCKKIGPFNRMTAEFEDLRIRREKRKEGRKVTPNADKTAAKEGHSDKVACLLFIATLETEQGPIVLKAQSKPISLTTAPEPAELDWLEPTRGHFGGQEIVVIKGSKMTSPKVIFRVQLPDGQIRDLHGSVDKERSHQNVLLVRTPSLSQYHLGNHPIQAQVVVITGRNQMPSNPLLFDFIPNQICISCGQETTHTAYPPVARPPPAVPAPLFTIPTPSSPPAPPSIHSAVPDTLCSQPVKPDVSSPDSICHHTTGYSPSSSPACSGVSVLIPGGSMPLQNIASPPTSADISKPNDDIMQIMHQLISSQEYHTANSNNTGASPKHPSYFVADNQSTNSPYLADVAANSPSSDRPQYSPITPSQSPPGMTSYPEQMLYSLKQKKMITESDFLLFISLYREHNPTFIQAVRAANGNEDVLLQLLASIKPDQGVFQSSQQ